MQTCWVRSLPSMEKKICTDYQPGESTMRDLRLFMAWTSQVDCDSMESSAVKKGWFEDK